MNILYFVARTSKQNLFSLIFEVVIKGCMTGGAWIQRATLQRATLQRAKLHCFFQDSHFFQFFSFSFKSVMAISASWIFLGRSSNFSSSSVMAVWTSLTFLEISSKWSKILDGRVPGSLSDRWSSLTTIYPLRFHEIFGRWLSFNMI